MATRFTWRASQGAGWALEAHGGAIVRFDDGQIAECWNLPAEMHAYLVARAAAVGSRPWTTRSWPRSRPSSPR